jgi:hypothetical protein
MHISHKALAANLATMRHQLPIDGLRVESVWLGLVAVGLILKVAANVLS